MVKKRNVVKSVLFFLMIMAILFFCLFPFAQMLSLSLKYSWDWGGNPSWIPSKVNLEAYKELLNIGSSLKDVPESVQLLLSESPDLTEAQKKSYHFQISEYWRCLSFPKIFRKFTLGCVLGLLHIGMPRNTGSILL